MNLRNKKTGKLYEWCSILVKKNRKSVKLLVAERDDDDREIYYYESFDKMCEEWETVEDPRPKEPLIKDEKMRKALRYWSEANNIKHVIVFDSNNAFPYVHARNVEFAENAGHLKVAFRTEELFDTNRIYTIEELCGEEE